ncbi:MAG: hypothetical protein FJ278_23140, partial [Planctomycetes bacterium]|nr:hypothetical protein [Planctomycetota bacterium]
MGFMRHLMSAMGITLVAFALGATVLGQNVLWLEAESREKTEGTVIFIDATKADFGRMAKADASG